MSKCEQCIVRQFSSLKALNKDELAKLAKLSPNRKDQIVKLVTRGELLGQRSMISEEPVN
jgi:hypothetical protein